MAGEEERPAPVPALTWTEALLANPATRHLALTADDMKVLVDFFGVKCVRLAKGLADAAVKMWDVERAAESGQQTNAEALAASRIHARYPHGHPLLSPCLLGAMAPEQGYAAVSVYGGVALDRIMNTEEPGAGLSVAAKVELVEDLVVCLLYGLKDIHTLKLVYRDLKPANVVYDASTRCFKIIDFGLAIDQQDGYFEGSTDTHLDPLMAKLVGKQKQFALCNDSFMRQATALVGCQMDLYLVGRVATEFALRLLAKDQSGLYRRTGIPAALHPRALGEDTASALEALGTWTTQQWAELLARTALPGELQALLLQLLDPEPGRRAKSAAAALQHASLTAPNARHLQRRPHMEAVWSAKAAATRAWLLGRGSPCAGCGGCDAAACICADSEGSASDPEGEDASSGDEGSVDDEGSDCGDEDGCESEGEGNNSCIEGDDDDSSSSDEDAGSEGEDADAHVSVVLGAGLSGASGSHQHGGKAAEQDSNRSSSCSSVQLGTPALQGELSAVQQGSTGSSGAGSPIGANSNASESAAAGQGEGGAGSAGSEAVAAAEAAVAAAAAAAAVAAHHFGGDSGAAAAAQAAITAAAAALAAALAAAVPQAPTHATGDDMAAAPTVAAAAAAGSVPAPSAAAGRGAGAAAGGAGDHTMQRVPPEQLGGNMWLRQLQARYADQAMVRSCRLPEAPMCGGSTPCQWLHGHHLLAAPAAHTAAAAAPWAAAPAGQCGGGDGGSRGGGLGSAASAGQAGTKQGRLLRGGRLLLQVLGLAGA